jgi:enamine deaminase RidA (YjgF/YER057c/UK114 family)
MAISKETKSLDMPWEKEYGYAQAVKVGDTIYLSGQVSHDEGGNIVGLRDMESQMRRHMLTSRRCLHSMGQQWTT